MNEKLRTFANGLIKEGAIIHIERNRFGEGKDEIWTAEWNEQVGRFYAYNQLNSVRDFDEDLNEPDNVLIVEVTKEYIFHPNVKKFVSEKINGKR